jgi:hypothetical protein
MAGYSTTPLMKKLGISDKSSIFLVNAPDNYFELLQANIQNQVVNDITAADFYHIFTPRAKELQQSFTEIAAAAKSDAIIWISWYKKASKIPTDVTEDFIHNVVLATEWVDVKVCAVSDIWSGLKVVKRLKNR